MLRLFILLVSSSVTSSGFQQLLQITPWGEGGPLVNRSTQVAKQGAFGSTLSSKTNDSHVEKG